MVNVVRSFRQLSVVKKADALSTTLIAAKPLVAKYQDNVVIGSWAVAENNRTVYVQILSSLSSAPIPNSQMSAQTWKFNGVVIDASDARFEIIQYNVGSTQVPGLKIKADIMDGLATTAFIEFSANVSTGGFTIPVHANIGVIRESVSPNTYTAYIIDANSRGATITQENQSVTLEVILEKGGIEVTSGLTYQWERVTVDAAADLANDDIADNRETIPGATQKTLIVNAADVATNEVYGVKVMENGILVKSASITVRDETDPLDLMIGSNIPFDAIDVGQNIVMTPKVVVFGTSNPVAGNWVYSYQKVNGDGTNIGNPTTGTSLTVTYAEVVAEPTGFGVFFSAKEV